ncbi:metallophosphoesterase [Nonomuraea sp. WAC 01424]|uniref:metallophosphoesterase family protein n=1 Tax=Nonomuraea sp. WAC 01424 TaxID=2203200 RepID=UPI0021AE163B|nr:metallophosphoesterase family protein [Nonomuraea sp. WAC 01424]
MALLPAPVHVVKGNNDGPDVEAPQTLELTLEGLRIGMIHDSGPAKGRLARLRRRFPEAALVVFGHSHIPLDESGDGLRIFNPGSPTDRRRQPHGTLGLLTVENGVLTRAEIVPVT